MTLWVKVLPIVVSVLAIGSLSAVALARSAQAATACDCVHTLFGTTAPAVADAGDTAAVELGVKFTTDVSGWITGVRFYKSAANTGAHTGSLWSATGAQLATATFTNETASGWQQVRFWPPLAVTAGTTYVASYHTTAGHYAFTAGGFTAAVDAPPLHALASAVAGGNGVFVYGGAGFPNQTFEDANYWVDVTFATCGIDRDRDSGYFGHDRYPRGSDRDGDRNWEHGLGFR